MTPSNAIYRKIFEVFSEHVSVYDYLPNDETKYPFLFIGRITNEDESNSDLIGVSNVNMDLYGLRVDRNRLDKIHASIHNDLIGLSEAYGYHINLVRLVSDVRPDHTDQQPLIRIMFDFDIQYTKKGVLK